MEANRQNVPEGELIRRDEAQIEPAEQNLTPEELLNASTVSSIEVAYATKLGKLKPYGYDKATGYS